MSVRRQRPGWIAPHRPLIQALGIRDLWVPQGGRIFNLAPGSGDLTADTASKWSTGPGGYGFDTQNVASQGYATSAQVVRSLPRTQATMFGVISVRSATSGSIYRFGYGGDTRYMIRMAFDATNGLKSGNITGGYATSDEQSMGVLPPLGHPFAFVALYSFAYNGAEDRRELHDSFGNKVLTATSNAAWDAIDSGYIRIGNDYTNAFDGHVYMVGSSERIWKQNEVEEFLADPYRMIDGARQRSRQFVYLAAGGTDATANGVTLTATASLIAGSATAASTAAAVTLTATASIITGSATAASVAAGVTLTATASLIPGSASGSSTGIANGVTLTATASLIAGTATAASTAAGTTLTATASIIAGSASGSAAGTANGVTLTGTATLIAGAATASSTATGQTLNITDSLIAGSASGASGGTAAGTTLTASSSMIPGAATAASSGPSTTWAATATIIAGGAQAGNPRPAASRIVRSRVGTRIATSR